MKTNKRIICAAAALVMAFGCAGAVPGGIFDTSITAAAAASYMSGDFKYELVFGEAHITGYLGSDADIVYPSELDGHTVTQINSVGKMLPDNTVKSITIPDTVKYVEGFANCQSLEKVTLGENVEEIGEYAFEYCSNLKEINFPDGLKKIGLKAFENTALKYVTFPDSLTEIGSMAFYNSKNLISVTISKNVTTIGNNVFWNCPSLESVEILCPLDTIYFGNWFRECSNIKNYSFKHGCTLFDGPSNNNKIEGMTAYSDVKQITGFQNCTKLDNVSLDCEKIGSDYSCAFKDCDILASVKLGSNVREINAFFNCTSLMSITIPKGVTKITDKTIGFYGTYHNETRYDGFTIYCYKGTEGEDYAKRNGFTNIVYLLDGNVNGDNTVDVDDLVLVQKAVAGWKIDENSKNAADVTGDGVVDVDDIIYIQKKVAGWKV